MKMLKSCLFVVVMIMVAAIVFSGCKKGGKLTSITVTPADLAVIPGTPLHYQAQGHLSDGANYFLATTIWSSSTPSVAEIDPTSGFVVTSATGATIITATDPYSTFTGTALLTVDLLSSITVTPTLPSMAQGSTHQFTATGFLATNGTQTITQDLTTFATLSWTTSSATATVVNTPGVAGSGVVTAGTTTGTVFIQAMEVTSGITGTTMLTVTSVPLSYLTITAPVNASIGLSTGATTTLQFQVQGTYNTGGPDPADWTMRSIWSSSDIGVATIDATGLAYAIGEGVTNIVATDPITSIATSTTLKVTP